MIAVLLSIVLFVIAMTLSKYIRKYFNIILGVSIVLSIVFYFVDLEIFTMGFLGLAFYVVVMYAGAFKRSSKISKRLRSVRKEYSILGFVFLLPHAIKYLIEFLNGSMAWEWLGVLAFLVMIPLFLTSFNYVKKQMNIKTWKQLQRWAYLVYALTFIHLLLIGQEDHVPAYIVLFGVYTFLKLYNYVFKKQSSVAKVVSSIIVLAIAALPIMKVSGFDLQTTFSFDFEDTSIDYNIEEIVDGTYAGYATGFQNLEVEVDVTVVDGAITTIDIIEDGSTSPRHGVDFSQAAEDIADDIIEYQSTDIDNISGATKTVDGIKDAVNDALQE